MVQFHISCGHIQIYSPRIYCPISTMDHPADIEAFQRGKREDGEEKDMYSMAALATIQT